MGRWVFTATSSGDFYSCLARSLRLSQKMLRPDLSVQSLMKPGVVDSKPAIVEIIKNIGIMPAKSDVGMIVRPPRVNSLGRNDILSGHHNHK